MSYYSRARKVPGCARHVPCRELQELSQAGNVTLQTDPEARASRSRRAVHGPQLSLLHLAPVCLISYYFDEFSIFFNIFKDLIEFNIYIYICFFPILRGLKC